MHTKPHFDNMIALVYFAFTTLATVGFGDYAPRSNPERVVGAFILLMGVAIFSFVMSIFSGLLLKLNKFNAEPEDDENLAKFLGVLKKFNKNKPLDTDFKKDIQRMFEHKWLNDRTAAFRGEDSGIA